MSPIQLASISFPGQSDSLQSLTDQAQLRDPSSVERVAADFESLFVSMTLKEMRQTLQPETLFGSDTSDAYGGLFDLYLGQHIVEAGGFGIANMVRQYLGKQKPE